MTQKTNPSQLITLLAKKAKDYQQFESEEKLTWCSGCGDYGVHSALKRALTLENLGLQDVLHCFDVGCSGNGSDKIHGYTVHGLHGRVLPLAAGAALANPNMKVIASAGDGATFSEGVNHLIHAIRSDYPLLFIMHNNENSGLTIGQASATTRKGRPMNGSPDGVTAEPLNPLELVLSLKPTFVARTFSGDIGHMTEVFRKGLHHNGFACIEVMQVCTTYNKATPQNWYWDRLKKVEEMKNYDKTDLWQARKIAEDLDKQIAIGVLYEKPRQNFIEGLVPRQKVKTSLVEEVRHSDVSEIMRTFD
ncbi:MAG: thiamine pyrophosphate-dependent enzyme [bacterium]|nr:thiamine pyrophosphate-dependent enzyme [bacterium]